MEHRPVSLADQVFERLESDILTGRYTRGEVLTELRLVEDLGADSANVMVMVMDLEDMFGLMVEDDAITNLRTVGDVVDYIEAHKD